MITEKSLVIYKNRPALVTGSEGEKINITVFEGENLKVREKDIELLHPGPCTLAELKENLPPGNVREAWELLSDGTAAGTSLQELAELTYGVFSPRCVWAAWELLKEGFYFTGNQRDIKARPRVDVEADEKKREEKERESGDRAAFLEKLKKFPPYKPQSLTPSPQSPDRRFLQDVEALARGQTGKSRTLRELGKSETPEEAHNLLLTCGVWTVWENPHPGRFGLGQGSGKIVPPPPPPEDRIDLSHLDSYAIDNPWSDDPDDAISLEGPDAQGRYFLWVHIADPAASILPGSPADIEAMGRGATLYLPEGACRMLNPGILPVFALGKGAISPALSFKMTLKPDLSIEETEVIPSQVKVTRLTYAEADALITAGESAVLTALAALAEQNVERRLDTGAVIIELPEAHISVSLGQNSEENRISVEPAAAYRSAGMVRECMLWAGEGIARWAMQKQLPFPYISQEAGELPDRRLYGLAGAWQLRRCMRPRTMSGKPAVHWGLGLDQYAQVSSPLRRYLDLLCHQQIRAWLNSGLYKGLKPLNEEEVLYRAAAAEAAVAAVNRAERASRAHWITVYLAEELRHGMGDSRWEGVVLDRKGNKGTVIIPALGLETQLGLRGNEEANDKVILSLSRVKIPEGEAVFSLQ